MNDKSSTVSGSISRSLVLLFYLHWWKSNMKRWFDWTFPGCFNWSMHLSLGAGCYLERLPGNLRSGVWYVFPTSSQNLSQHVCSGLSVFNQSYLVGISLPVDQDFFWAEIWAWRFMNAHNDCGENNLFYKNPYISGIVDWIICCCGHKILLLLLVGFSDFSICKVFG